MCGILVYKNNGNNDRIRYRGQDYTGVYELNGYTFVHSLLSVTGKLHTQPMVDGGIVCLFNGEIYNHKFSVSDGENIIPLYKKYGNEFPKYLDGEWAIALYDFSKGRAIFTTDPFGTKPLFVKGTECGSYRSGVRGYRMKPNTVRVVDIGTEKFEEHSVVEWDFDNQHKDTYEDWIKSFDIAIKKRAVPGCFIGLSSGYDSGAIACSMLKQKIPFKAYIFRGSENLDVIEKRLKHIPEYSFFTPLKKVLETLEERVDNEPYTIYYDGEKTTMSLLDDGGLAGIGTICYFANKEGRRVMLSGQGADEILSDYSLFPSQSELKGVFPEKLKKWRNFDEGCQESYLIKEESGAGAFNVEGRYPFLDKQLVQEFLWLTTELKNSAYKAPLKEYLIRNNFPFQEGRKIGFSVNV